MRNSASRRSIFSFGGFAAQKSPIPADPAYRLVWDLPVRTMHWLLVFATAGAWLTHYDMDRWFAIHVACGCTVLIVVVTRIVWGFAGTYHARFINFVRGPVSTIHYIRRIGNLDGFAGHNPLGAWMVLLLLAALLAQALTGLFASDHIFNTGPLSGYVSAAASDKLAGIHRLLWNVILVAICAHVTAVFAYLIIKRKNLILPMLTGRKPAAEVPQHLAIRNSRTGLAIAVGALLTCVLLLLLYAAPPAAPGF